MHLNILKIYTKYRDPIYCFAALRPLRIPLRCLLIPCLDLFTTPWLSVSLAPFLFLQSRAIDRLSFTPMPRFCSTKEEAKDPDNEVAEDSVDGPATQLSVASFLRWQPRTIV